MVERTATFDQTTIAPPEWDEQSVCSNSALPLNSPERPNRTGFPEMTAAEAISGHGSDPARTTLAESGPASGSWSTRFLSTSAAFAPLYSESLSDSTCNLQTTMILRFEIELDQVSTQTPVAALLQQSCCGEPTPESDQHIRPLPPASLPGFGHKRDHFQCQ